MYLIKMVNYWETEFTLEVQHKIKLLFVQVDYSRYVF